MAIVTKNAHAWFVTTNSSGKKQTVYNNETEKHNYPFGFEIHFSDVPQPQQNTVTLYNLSKSHSNFYRKKQKCYVAWNWNSTERKILAEGYITKIDVTQHDGTTDTKNITFTEGTDYNNLDARTLKETKNKKVKKTKTKKEHISGHFEHLKSGKKKWVKGKTVNKHYHTRENKKIRVNKTYRKGTSYKSLIKGIASQSGVKIAKIDLAKNPKLKRPYTASGKPLSLIKQLVKKTGSKMTYVRGKLEIVNPKSGKRTWYEIDDQDLVQPPSSNEDNGGEKTWEITIPLVPEITTNTGIIMKSKYLKGRYYVKSGTHSFDGDSPQTQCSLARL